MGFVEPVYSSVVAFLGEVSETQFGAVAEAVGSTGVLMASIVAMLVIINLITNLYAQPAMDGIKLCVKLVFVALFFRNWAQFDTVASGIFDIIDRVGSGLITSVNAASPGESISGFSGIADSIDGLIDSMNNAATLMSARLGVIGGGPFVSVIIWLITSILGAAAIVLMVISRVAITVLIGLAPIMILFTLFEQTKNYFERWVSALVTFALFPVVAAGVFATIIGITSAALKRAGDPSSFNSMGDFAGILITGLLSIALITTTPLLVGTLAGNYFMRLPGMGALAGKAAGMMPGSNRLSAAASGAMQNVTGFANSARAGEPVVGHALQQHQASLARTLHRFKPK